MKYEILGNILDSSGYANHTRGLFNALAKTEDVKLTTQLVPDWFRRVNDKELEAIKKPWEYDRVKIIITHPVHWRANLTNKRNWVYLIWEGDRVPISFIEECRNPEIEKIIVASQHTSDALFFTIDNMWHEAEEKDMEDSSIYDIMDKVVIIPHGVDHSIFYPVQTKKEKFTFLVNKGWRNNEDRGGTQYAIKAYMAEFTNKEDVELIVKINPAYGVPNVMNLINELVDKNRKDLPVIKIDAGNYEYNQLNKLYNAADVFISATRAEAFNIPVLEAMSCAKPVITTDFGGQTDFSIGWPIPYKLEEVKHEVQYEGIQWATPDVDSLRVIMRQVVNQGKGIEEIGKEALIKSMSYSWDITAEKFKEL